MYLYKFFDFFEKTKNHEIDDPYNVLEGFSPCKTSHFSMDFPSFFMFFPEPLPETVLRGSRCRSCLESAILEPLSISSESQNQPWSVIFTPKLLSLLVPSCIAANCLFFIYIIMQRHLRSKQIILQ